MSTVDPEMLLQEALGVALWKRNSDELNINHRILAVVIRDEDGKPTSSVRIGGKLTFQIFFRSEPDEKGHISLVIKNKYDQIVSCTGSYFLGIEPPSAKDGSYGVFELELDCMLEAGLYSIMFAVGTPTVPNQGEYLDQTDWLGPLRVDWNYELERAPFLGMFGLPVKSDVAPRKMRA